MTGPPRDEFVDHVRRLDRGALTELVADVYDARDWRVDDTGDGRLLVRAAQGDRVERLTIRVAESLPADPGDADVVVVGDVLDGERLGDGARVIDAPALHRMALYAVDRDRLSDLLADHFGPEAFAERERHPGRWMPSTPRMPSMPRPRLPEGRAGATAVALGVVVLGLLGLALASSVGHDRSADVGIGVEQTVTPAPVAETVTETTPSVASPCPPPPTDVHPAVLRPAPVDAAVSTGLEGWSIEGAINVSYFHGPNELEVSARPEHRHKATYRSPRETAIGLFLDRWLDRATATDAGPALAEAYGTALVWGRYTVTATVYERSASESTVSAEAYTLFSHVINPDAGQLGVQCVHHAAVESGD
ncbi:hypothetical protein [Halomicrobium urmianum]|uniref:hypothetical protein n=1 Tax=Halomicrobium urmianum TaxID=1586233 RepID=UPI001CD9CC6B|nr:hypothetical protein [Halomicrobium urmianum]